MLDEVSLIDCNVGFAVITTLGRQISGHSIGVAYSGGCCSTYLGVVPSTSTRGDGAVLFRPDTPQQMCHTEIKSSLSLSRL